MPTTSLDRLIEEFAAQLRTAQGRGAQTAANYTAYLRRFAQTAAVKTPDDITPEIVERFRIWLTSNRGGKLRVSTANYYLTALRTFLKYLKHRQITTFDPSTIRLERVQPRTIATLEAPGVNRLLNFPVKMDGRSILQSRDRGILELLGSTGLRVGEVSRLKRDSLTAGGSELAVHGRRGKIRIVPLTQQARYWIEQYLKVRRDRAPELFVRHDPAARRAPAAPSSLTPRSIQRLMKKYSHAAGLGKNVQPRMLRHTVAAKMLADGHDLETVRERLGHMTVASTKIYLRRKR